MHSVRACMMMDLGGSAGYSKADTCIIEISLCVYALGI